MGFMFRIIVDNLVISSDRILSTPLDAYFDGSWTLESVDAISFLYNLVRISGGFPDEMVRDLGVGVWVGLSYCL